MQPVLKVSTSQSRNTSIRAKGMGHVFVITNKGATVQDYMKLFQ